MTLSDYSLTRISTAVLGVMLFVATVFISSSVYSANVGRIDFSYSDNVVVSTDAPAFYNIPSESFSEDWAADLLAIFGEALCETGAEDEDLSDHDNHCIPGLESKSLFVGSVNRLMSGIKPDSGKFSSGIGLYILFRSLRSDLI